VTAPKRLDVAPQDSVNSTSGRVLTTKASAIRISLDRATLTRLPG